MAHPEKQGLVQPVSIDERLLHIALAKEQLGTKMPWLADSMKNELKHAFGDRPNSEFVISAEKKVVVSRSWSDPEQLRRDLEKLVGKSETLTTPETAGQPVAKVTYASGVIPRVPKPEGVVALKATPLASEHPYYVKNRVEGQSSLLNGENGKLHLGFHLDPIHQVHWNHLVAPLAWEIEAPEGVTVTPAKGNAAQYTEADIDPREFIVDVSGTSEEPLKLTIHYFACDNLDRWCKAVTQEVEIAFQQDKDAGRVFGGSRRGGGRRGGRRGKGNGGGPDPARMMRMMDQNGDGKIAKDEARGRMAERFSTIDTDEDGFVSAEELKKRKERRR